MDDTVSFALESPQKIKFEDYDSDEFAIAKMSFLGSNPNSHGLNISEDVLKECAGTACGKWLVSKMNLMKTDMEGHEPTEQIMGVIPKDQEIEYSRDDDGYLRANANVVVSKVYAKDFCKVLSSDGDHAVSVEMSVKTTNGNSLNDTVEAFNIVGVTVLGRTIKPSCTGANIEFVRFAEDAENYYGKAHLASTNNEAEMEEKKTYKVDKSKESMSEKAWGDVDKASMRNKIMEATNKSSLVKAVYLLVEDGWEDAPSEHLKYPVMTLKGDTFVYNRGGLSSALAYAKQENETSVVNKIEKIYKSLDIEESRKEGESKMAEIEFAAVDISDMWSKIYEGLHAKYPDGEYGSVYYIDGIFEESESKQKFVIVRHKAEDNKYRLNFSFTEEGLVLADELVKVEIEIVETDEVRKFAEPEDAEKYKSFAEEKKEPEEKAEEEEAKLESTEKEENPAPEEKEANLEEETEEQKAEMSADEMKAEMARLKSEIETRDNIIMEKDTKMGEMETELAELRKFKQACMEAERAAKVEAVMNSVASYMDDASAEDYRAKGMACDFAEFDAWSNEVKAVAFEKMPENVKKAKADEEDIVRMSGVIDFSEPTPSTALERLKRRKH